MENDIPQQGQPPEVNEAAFFAQQYLAAGKRLDLGPSLQEQDDGLYQPANLDESEDTAKFYEQNNQLGIDIDAPGAEQHWASIEKALRDRHTEIGRAHV